MNSKPYKYWEYFKNVCLSLMYNSVIIISEEIHGLYLRQQVQGKKIASERQKLKNSIKGTQHRQV